MLVDPSIGANPVFRGDATGPNPPVRLPDHDMPPHRAYQLVHDEAMLDGNARQNLATFVTTWMPEDARTLFAEVVDRNMVDRDEYRQTARIEDRCWRIVADLWNAPDRSSAYGTSTVGSSEACMLAGLVFKRRWQLARRARGLDIERPNLIMSSAVQVCWEKFCTFFEVEPRFVPISEEHPCLDGSQLDAVVDDRTIGVVGIMGVTYTGMYEPIADLARALDDIERARGLDVPIHVDAASGGFVAPFLQPELAWDFRVDRVMSISASGHKYGLVYPGVGWAVWRDLDDIPDELIFRVSYLGGEDVTFGLNFSKPGAQVLLQYYQFLRLGRAGYTAVQQGCRDIAQFLAAGIAGLGPFELWNDGSDIPVFAWRRREGSTSHWTLFDLSDRLRQSGWQVPAYPMPDTLTDVIVQRIVVRNGLSLDLAGELLRDIRRAVDDLDRLSSPPPSRRDGHAGGFAH